MVVRKVLSIALVLAYIVHLSSSQQMIQKKKVVVDIDKSLTKYLAKFYKVSNALIPSTVTFPTSGHFQHRLVEGQNNALAPLLDLYVLVLLYQVSDGSTKTDVHTLLNIPEDAEDGTMDKFEAKLRQYLEKFGLFGTKLFVDSTIKATPTELRDKKFFSTDSIRFSQKDEFLRKINSWMTSMGMPNNAHFVHNFNFDDKTVSLILQVMSYRWKLPLAVSTTSKKFLGEEVRHLEGSLQGNYAAINQLGIQVLEQMPSNADVKLWLILPNSMVTFINKTFEDNTISEISTNLKNKQQLVKISIPQVKIEFNSEENAFIQSNFHVLTSMFSSPSIRLESNKENKYPIKAFLAHCLFQFEEDNSAKVSNPTTLTLNFDKPFTIMVLTKDTNIPLLMANYFSVKDKMLAMEDEEQLLAEQVAREALESRADL
uniref:Putative serine proteinase inhibitor n=1 Tax=Culex tarsalis TaxID=7177 RepID=A0A1Q3FC85_CULTA